MRVSGVNHYSTLERTSTLRGRWPAPRACSSAPPPSHRPHLQGPQARRSTEAPAPPAPPPGRPPASHPLAEARPGRCSGWRTSARAAPTPADKRRPGPARRRTRAAAPHAPAPLAAQEAAPRSALARRAPRGGCGRARARARRARGPWPGPVAPTQNQPRRPACTPQPRAGACRRCPCFHGARIAFARGRRPSNRPLAQPDCRSDWRRRGAGAIRGRRRAARARTHAWHLSCARWAGRELRRGTPVACPRQLGRRRHIACACVHKCPAQQGGL